MLCIASVLQYTVYSNVAAERLFFSNVNCLNDALFRPIPLTPSPKGKGEKCRALRALHPLLTVDSVQHTVFSKGGKAIARPRLLNPKPT